MNRQSQSAGNYSTQVQASGDVVVGVTESRAREIAEVAARSVVAQYTDESIRIVQERITKLDDRVIAALIREGRLEVFADPGFQRSYTKAQMGAAVSDKDGDYDLLAGLLIDRVERGGLRNVRAGIERAIEVIDQIDEEALRGLTVFQAIQGYQPLSPHLESGLDTLEKLFSDLADGPLPSGNEWLDHLDILDAIRINHASSLKPFREYYPTQMPGYLASGAPLGSPRLPFVIDGKPVFGPNLLTLHELRSGHYRFAVATAGTLKRVVRAEENVLSELLKQAESHLGFGEIDSELIDPFIDRLRLRPTLNKIEAWWDQIPQAVQVTGVGKVLARSNALRLDHRGVLPPVD
ncbi:LPO_1073/Vpar_1526 family protein [Corynebacterium testudinoris]|uniref:LPO_1073/Vpar_1526 family protein n=1 Tax=Corynebacterium testudinoris TaxID=136857 RepID=UPI0011876966|nr:LPO_1073/Vpar_1526 family protein [Corynebacterium testudinoris]